MKHHKLSIRSRLLLAGLTSMLLFLFVLLLFLDTDHRLNERTEKAGLYSGLLEEQQQLVHHFLLLTETNDASTLSSCLASCNRMAQLSATLGEEDQLAEILDALYRDLGQEASAGHDSWISSRAGLKLLGEELSSQMENSRTEEYLHSERYRRLVIFLTVLGLLVIASIALLISRETLKAIGILNKMSRSLEEGRLTRLSPDKLPGEIGEIGSRLDRHLHSLQEKKSFVESLVDEDAVAALKPEKTDELGQALLSLSDTMAKKDLQVLERNRVDRKKNWISEGIAQVGEVLRSQSENMDELAFALVQKLVMYMNVEMGSLYITSENEEGMWLDLKASYAYDRRKYKTERLAWGEDLPGTCAREKKKIFLTEIPPEYFEISSGTITAKPNCLLLVPLMVNEQVNGILELATVRLLRKHEMDFVESLADSIASTLMSVRINQQTSRLLEQSQAANLELREELSSQAEEISSLSTSMKAEKLKQEEALGALSAVGNIALMAELSTSGRFMHMNEAFLQSLECTLDQVSGKRYDEFARVDPYSDESKTFWADLRKGKEQSTLTEYQLYSGKTRWLQQHFTPFTDKDGKVLKIHLVASDLSETSHLREKLEVSESSLSQKQKDMHTLMAAVNQSLVRCELDGEGIIVDINDKYADLTGSSRKEVIGRNYRLFLKDSEKEQFETIWEDLRQNRIFEGVIRRSDGEGRESWIMSTFSPVMNEAEELYKVYFLGLDVTEKRQKYQMLDEANREIERLREQLEDRP